jgi:hypothetical protein
MADLNQTLRPAFIAVAIDDEGRACADIPDSVCREEPTNFFTHVAALSLSKIADGLIDPKLVLSWLMVTLGAPAALVGLLVPIREAGALLPQLFSAGALRRLPKRKFAWAAGAAIQGLSALALAVSALTLSGTAAGIAILTALTVLALARSVCSVCYKDVLGKTIDVSRRGSATGLAGSIAAAFVICFALALSFDLMDRRTLVTGGLFVAGLAWIGGAALFATLSEQSGASDGGKNAFAEAKRHLSYLKTEPQLRRFIAVRGLLTATALAPPFMIAAASGDGGAFEQLGFLVLASASAGLLSSFVWGRLSDRSSRNVLLLSSVISGLVLAAAAGLSLLGHLSSAVLVSLLLFALMIAYQGVRLGRSTHLVDMANKDTRAAFTALSNTAIGLLLIAGGGFSLLASVTNAGTVLGVMAAMCTLAIPVTLGLDEVQES